MDDKPISIILDDLKNKIANAINEANLPPCLVRPVIKDIYDEVVIFERQQLEKDKASFNAKEETTNP